MPRNENFPREDSASDKRANEAQAASANAFEDVVSVWKASKSMLPDQKSLKEGITGVGEGLLQAAKETVDLSALRDGILQAADAARTIGEYTAHKVASGDLKGFVRDLKETGETIKDLGFQYIHLPPKEQGRIIGHDVLPNLIPSEFGASKDGKLLKGAAEILTKAVDHNLPSHEMLGTLDHAYEQLHPMEKEFLNRHDIKVTGVARAIDTEFGGVNGHTLGFYSSDRKTIGVAQEVNVRDKWIPNNQIEFTLKHELGHAFNQLGGDNRPGNFISERPEFVRAFERDTSRLPSGTLDALGLLRANEKLTRDEVFAELYAHASSGITTDGASGHAPLCFPSCYEYVRGFHNDK
jgi:hypothetical protein